MTTKSTNFSDLGVESQKLIINQIQQIDLETVSISPKSLSTLGTSLMKILRTANSNQEKTKEEIVRDNWIIIRQLSHSLLEEILEKVEFLAERGEIPEWERPSIMNLLHDITKACYEEELRTNLANSDDPNINASDEFISEMLEDKIL